MVQTHVHIAKTLGTTPEFSPVYKWSVMFPNFVREPMVIIGINRTLTGKLMKHRLQSGGSTKKFSNYQLTVKVVAEYSYTLAQRVEQLLAMQGEAVYFTPLDHAADAADHTADTKTMFLSRMTPLQPYTPMLERYDVEIELLDDYTVT